MTGSGQPAQPRLASSGESQLSTEDVHVWYVDIEALAGRVHQWANLLSSMERSRADAFIHSSDRERFIIAHGVLRTLIGRYLGTPPASLQFSEIGRKKPCLAGIYGDSGLQFNLSHSHGYALLAFTYQRQIGIDIEYARPMPDLEQIAARTFSSQENTQLKKLSPEERRAAFYRCWTRKEAFVKALGDGLYYPLDRFSVSISSESLNCLLQIEEHPTETLRWTILGLDAAPGYEAALAVDGHDWRPVFWQYSLADETDQDDKVMG
jgi:4'-phosphopantetheinyl transferase